MDTKRQLRASERRMEEALCKSILDYLQRHPHAEDTIEGIAQWWLLEQRIHEGILQVRAALGTLKQRNQIDARPGPDGRIYYRLKR